MSKYKPGPWEAEDSPHKQEWSHWINDIDGKVLAAVVNSDSGECDANAHLIKAAPDLLEACDFAIDVICPDGDRDSMEEWAKVVYDKLKYASCKATGDANG